MHAALADGNTLHAKLLLRFLCELANCGMVEVTGEQGVCAYMRSLISRLDDDAVSSQHKDLSAYMVLSAIPSCCETLASEAPEELKELLAQCQTFMSARQTSFDLSSNFRRVLSPPATTPDSLVVLWQVIEPACADDGVPIKVHSITKPWRLLEDTLQGGTKHPLSEALPMLTTEVMDTFPITAEFPLFDADSGGAAAAAASIPEVERVAVRDLITDSCSTFRPDCRWDGIRLGSLRNAAEQLLSVSEIAPAECHSEYLIVEAVLLLILQFPQRDGAYLTQLVLELCRASPSTIPPALACAVELLFRRLDELDYVAVEQLATWFAHHLNNTKFRWPFWQYWVDVANAEPNDRQRLFVTRVLEVGARLSYVDRIKCADGFPEELHSLLPMMPTALSRLLPAVDAADALDGPEGATPFQKLVVQLRDKLAKRAPIDDIDEALRAADEDEDEELELPPLWRPTALMHALLMCGSASISHSLSLFDRYRDLLVRFAESEEDQHSIIDSIAEVWASSNQQVLFFIDALLRRRVVQMTAVISWVFHEQNSTSFASRHFGSSFAGWELIDNTLDRSIDALSASVLATSSSSAAKEADDDDSPADEKVGTAVEKDSTAMGGTDDSDSARNPDPEHLAEAREVCVELFGRLVRALDAALQIQDAADPWIQATQSILHAASRKYADMSAPTDSLHRSTESVALSSRSVLDGLQGKIMVPDGSELRALLEQLASDASVAA